MSIMVSVEFSLQDGKQKEFLEFLAGALKDTRAFDGCMKVETFAEEDATSVILIEEWETKKHQEVYFQWRLDTGLGDALGPYISAAPKIRYYEIRPE